MISTLAGQARQQTTTRLNDQKERASAGLESAAHALRQTSQTMREKDEIGVSQYADQAAMQLERAARYLHTHDVSDLVSGVETFARRRPSLFLGAAFGLGFLATRFLKSSGQGGAMPGMESGRASHAPSWKTVEVNVPVRVAYNQWTQFEDFPHFMEGVKQVEQISDRRLRWRAEIAGKEEQWDAVITEQMPDRRIAWRNTSGARNAGVVTFYPLGPARTRIALQIDYQPEGPIEQVGAALGLVERRIEGDLQRFKEFIESRGTATGAWRGEIHGEQVQGH